MDPATFQLILLIGGLASQVLPLLYQVNTSGFTPEQKIQWVALIARIEAARDLVTPYVKEPEA
jgi:hypothetical protein